jgi:hypothetical protein
MINYHDKKFSVVSNSETGETNSDTIFHYQQERNIVWAKYQGGKVQFGSLIGIVSDEGQIDMRYQQVNEKGGLMTGKCVSTPEVLADGRIRLHEVWKWTSGDLSEGKSIIEELKR